MSCSRKFPKTSKRLLISLVLSPKSIPSELFIRIIHPIYWIYSVYLLSLILSSSWIFPLILFAAIFFSAQNPFIYAAASPEFRRAFKRVLCCAFLNASSKRQQRILRYEMSVSSVRNANASSSQDSTGSYAAVGGGENDPRRVNCFSRFCRPCPTPTCLSPAKDRPAIRPAPRPPSTLPATRNISPLRRSHPCIRLIIPRLRGVLGVGTFVIFEVRNTIHAKKISFKKKRSLSTNQTFHSIFSIIFVVTNSQICSYIYDFLKDIYFMNHHKLQNYTVYCSIM